MGYIYRKLTAETREPAENLTTLFSSMGPCFLFYVLDILGFHVSCYYIASIYINLFLGKQIHLRH